MGDLESEERRNGRDGGQGDRRWGMEREGEENPGVGGGPRSEGFCLNE